jgi:dTDP-4-amino-4,6-dideoxygalactose transaminase
LLRGHEQIQLLEVEEDAESSYWVFTLRLKVNEQRRDAIIENLNNKEIGAGLVHLPNDRYSAFSEFSRELVNTNLFSTTQISLPCGWWLESSDIDFIAQTLIQELEQQNV